MKTKSFLLGAAAIMLATSCSNDEVVKVAENSAAIGFSSFVNKSTRATEADDYTLNNLNDLKVYGVTFRGSEGAYTVDPFKVFTGTKVTKGTPVWSYSPVQYWIAGNDYTFAAVAPAEATGVTVNQGTVTNNGGIEFINFTNAGNLDLLYASYEDAKNVAANRSEVGFTLNHLLSRVRFQFSNDLTAGYSVVVKNLKITDAVRVGKFTPTTTGQGIWEPTEYDNPEAENAQAYEFAMTEDKTANGEELPVSEHKYLIPTGSAVYNVAFDIELYYTEEGKAPTLFKTYEHASKLPAINFASGSSYTLKSSLTWKNIDPNVDELKPIEFTVDEVKGWSDWTTTEIPGFDKTENSTTTGE